MKRKLGFLTTMLVTTWTINAQTMYAPLAQFADACVQMKQAIWVEKPDYEKQFEQLDSCLNVLVELPLVENSPLINASHSCGEQTFDGHLVFSPAYIADYLNGKIPDPRKISFPYLFNEPVSGVQKKRETKPTEVDMESIYYTNALVCPYSEETIRYKVTADTQYMVVVAENDTPLEVIMTASNGTEIRDNTSNGKAQLIWQTTEKLCYITVNVVNPSNKHVSFVIAIY